MAQRNACIYSVENNIDFIECDFINYLDQLKNLFCFADVIFMSPPWGGPNYMKQEVFNLNHQIPEIGCSMSGLIQSLLEYQNLCKKQCELVFFLPRNSDLNQLSEIIRNKDQVVVEINVLNQVIKGLTVYVN
eukprot:TRINITY_DN7168_c0_g1_i3.p2 TRINITY_DN7168_c0_g1~~TRINITY_DN7168_c0_g1_i3.p2  ORF type:complete len:132 (-),score=13.68 TRINITY_DN7168_c0_g1_i3:209-604(-)